ncbi:MAG: AMP-binding protein [Proteobacteria bacterium]|nr:AMP-binding protein [Pseudomonadota bacterium]
MVVGEQRTTFREFWRLIAAAGALYERWGVRKGDPILIVLPNGLPFLIYHFAALKIGAISVPIKSEFRCWEIAHILRDSEARLLVTCDAWLDENPEAARLSSELRTVSIDGLEVNAIEGEDQVRHVRSETTASINYCYVGTGRAKGAVLTHGNHIYAATGYTRHQGFSVQDRFLIILPMAHVYALSGCINSGLIRGGTLVIIRNYSPRAILRAIQDYRITILTAVPAIFEYVVGYRRRDRFDLSSLRLCVTGGDFMPAALQEQVETVLGSRIVQGYGLTESLPIICNPPSSKNKHGTLGIPGRRDIWIRILDEDWEPLGPGRVGEIAILSPTTMAEYHRDPASTQKILRDGWLRTGDLGKLDEDGYLYFSGLKKNIFNIYGNKVDPLELKAVLLLHPAVRDVDVYLERSQNQDRIIGAVAICAKLTLNESGSVSPKQIRAFCRERLASYKVPKEIHLS